MPHRSISAGNSLRAVGGQRRHDDAHRGVGAVARNQVVPAGSVRGVRNASMQHSACRRGKRSRRGCGRRSFKRGAAGLRLQSPGASRLIPHLSRLAERGCSWVSPTCIRSSASSWHQCGRLVFMARPLQSEEGQYRKGDVPYKRANDGNASCVEWQIDRPRCEIEDRSPPA